MAAKEELPFDIQKFMVTAGSRDEFGSEVAKNIDVANVPADQIADLLEEQALQARLEREKQEKLVKEEKPVEKKAADTGLADPHCPHCGWDQGKKVAYKPTDDDRQTFIESLVTGLPFAKKFVMANGRVTIVFRALRDEELHCLLGDYARACAYDRTTTTNTHQKIYQDAQPLLQIQELSIAGGAKFAAPEAFAPAVTPWAKDYILTEEQYNERLKDKKPLLDLLTLEIRKKCPPTARPLISKAATMFYSVYDALSQEFSQMVDEEQKEQQRNF